MPVLYGSIAGNSSWVSIGGVSWRGGLVSRRFVEHEGAEAADERALIGAGQTPEVAFVEAAGGEIVAKTFERAGAASLHIAQQFGADAGALGGGSTNSMSRWVPVVCVNPR